MVTIISAPSKRQFRHVSRTHNDSIFLIREIHKYHGPGPGLGIFKCDITYKAAAFLRLAYAFQMYRRLIPDINSHQSHSEKPGKPYRIILRPAAGPESRHGHAYDILSVHTAAVICIYCSDKCKCRIKTT